MIHKDVEYVVIGAGVIGLAIARELAVAKKEVLVLEKNATIGEEASFRNSAVIHAGIYYSTDSLKAKFCREGQSLLYAYCKYKKIPHLQIGKLIVISKTAQKAKLQNLFNLAKKNGVEVYRIDQAELQQMEPNLHALTAIYSPTTGIIDGRALIKHFKLDIENNNGNIMCQTLFQSAAMCKKKFIIRTSNQNAQLIKCDFLINAAGLWATQVAKNIVDLAEHTIPAQFYAKGHYFKLLSAQPFSKLIYPLPEKAGLGIHATLDVNAQTRFGPDVEWVNKIEYGHSAGREKKFYHAIRQYYPHLADDALRPDFVGIRSKISPPLQQPQDFLLHTEKQHGIKNLINLYGMDSPGLTAAMAIASHLRHSIV